jgi:hypothetical protein
MVGLLVCGWLVRYVYHIRGTMILLLLLVLCNGERILILHNILHIVVFGHANLIGYLLGRLGGPSKYTAPQPVD